MPNSFLPASLLACVLILSACSKKDNPSPSPIPPKPIPLLDSMVWNQAATTTYFTYRPDSLQDKITTVSAYVSDTARFEYNGRQLARIINNRLGRSSIYEYNTTGQIDAITMTGFSPDGNVRFEYGYYGDGRLASLTFFAMKNGQNQKLSSFNYIYDTDGLLRTINGLTTEGLPITTTIDAYTEECDFNPWIFIDPVDLEDAMEVYNLPLLQSLHRLPARITRSSATGGFIRTTTATIQDRHLTKMTTGMSYPSNPGQNYQFDIGFFHRH